MTGRAASTSERTASRAPRGGGGRARQRQRYDSTRPSDRNSSAHSSSSLLATVTRSPHFLYKYVKVARPRKAHMVPRPLWWHRSALGCAGVSCPRSGFRRFGKALSPKMCSQKGAPGTGPNSEVEPSSQDRHAGRISLENPRGSTQVSGRGRRGLSRIAQRRLQRLPGEALCPPGPSVSPSSALLGFP